MDAFLRPEKERGKLRWRGGAGGGPADEPFVQEQRRKLEAAGVLGDSEFFPNLDRAAKLDFFRSLSLMSTPALYGEAFGLYLIEAMAAGVPVVQPRHGAFPELVAATGGGIICDPTAEGLARAIEQLLRDPITLGNLADTGRKAVFQRFNTERMARDVAAVCEELV